MQRDIYEGEGGASFGGEDDVDHSVSIGEEWLGCVLFDMNIDPMIQLGDSAHPNTPLYDGHPDILNPVKKTGKATYRGSSHPKVVPESGLQLSGKYGVDDLIVSVNSERFDICNFSVILRVFVEPETKNVIAFGESYRWLCISKNSVTFNNQRVEHSFNLIKDNEWNEIMMCFSYDRECLSGKCLLLVNGEEFEAPLDGKLNILECSERTISHEKAFSFSNYSNGNTFKGIIGSIILLNSSCESFSELMEVGKYFLANHKKQTLNKIVAKVPSKTQPVASTVDENKSEPHHIESEDQFNKLVKNNRLLVLDFYATWCGPCIGIAPKFSELANKYKNVAFVKVDIDTQPKISATYRVRCMPTFCFIKDGVEIDRLEGANVQTLESKIKSLI